MNHLRRFLFVLSSLLLLSAANILSQETTAGLQGVVKDPSGAVVAGAQVVATAETLVGEKTTTTDSAGYYRFANLPPGTYAITVKASGFKTIKKDGVALATGHLPTLDFSLQVGGTESVVEVSGEAPAIDVSTNHTMTNVDEQTLSNIPVGRSFQSVIQFAPAASNEPLAGSLAAGGPQGTSGGNGTGGQSPGSGGNGSSIGYSVAGGSDSENSYLIEGQQTNDAIGGFSHTNVPMDFIQEVQIKTSGLEAEHGGALGGVVNVIMQKGGNAYHGAVWSQFESRAWDGSPVGFSRYDPQFNNTINPSGTLFQDPDYQFYQAKKDTGKDIFPGFKIGGPLVKNRLNFFLGFNPEFTTQERKVVMSSNGLTPFSRNSQTYYTNARVDAVVSQKVRLFGSWLYQYQRLAGEALPYADSVNGQYNASSSSPIFAFAHNLGYGAPNVTTNIGADFTFSPRVVATFRWGYFFQNYHDFGYPTNGTINIFEASCSPTCADNGGGTISGTSLNQTNGFVNVANNNNATVRDATKGHQIDASLLYVKSGFLGTHNLKLGYSLNRISNSIFQHWNEPAIRVFPGSGNYYNPQGSVGATNCAAFEALYGGNCAGQYGYFYVQDYGSYGYAASYNHALFAQDSWTIGRGLTINAGLRVEKENLPAENQPGGGVSNPISFAWTDKIAPRIGVAWDVFRDGRMKVFGSYGVYYDVMKLNLAISSFGGQYWQNCYYALNTSDLSTVLPAFDSTGRDCVGPDSSSQATFSSASNPASYTFLENQNFRTFPTTCSTCTSSAEGVAPGLKPYRQHESVFGVDYALTRTLALEARWDRRRLDHVIEDSSIFNPAIGETFVIVNPGQGVDSTFSGFYNFLAGDPNAFSCTPGFCPPNRVIPAARNYDGVELRLTKHGAGHWAGMFSYTYSHFRGNYTGLSSTEIGDGGGGRNAPNNSRSFDEPFFSWDSAGGSASGLLPTDRPNKFKGYAYYELGWKNRWTTDIGLFQFAYQGSPQATIADLAYSFAPPAGAFATSIVGRSNWIDVTQDPTTGALTVGSPRLYRAPWFTQTNLSLSQSYKIGENKVVSFGVNFDNLLNQRAVTSYYPYLNSQNYGQFLSPFSPACGVDGGFTSSGPCPIYFGADAYSAYMRPYDPSFVLNNASGVVIPNSSTNCTDSTGPVSCGTGPLTVNSLYGKPYTHQTSRAIRLRIGFTF